MFSLYLQYKSNSLLIVCLQLAASAKTACLQLAFDLSAKDRLNNDSHSSNSYHMVILDKKAFSHSEAPQPLFRRVQRWRPGRFLFLSPGPQLVLLPGAAMFPRRPLARCIHLARMILWRGIAHPGCIFLSAGSKVKKKLLYEMFLKYIE